MITVQTKCLVGSLIETLHNCTACVRKINTFLICYVDETVSFISQLSQIDKCKVQVTKISHYSNLRYFGMHFTQINVVSMVTWRIKMKTLSVQTTMSRFYLSFPEKSFESIERNSKKWYGYSVSGSRYIPRCTPFFDLVMVRWI